ncbi:hypothetical protein BKA61DRAFT_696236 [Leptodontidium sp. MPI-SDFR-AT-0119]|nr:hypothetical protein BKA61DRAFT_696236 [Leptodontidium sp. MPI-SDFR-AT-0119]
MDQAGPSSSSLGKKPVGDSSFKEVAYVSFNNMTPENRAEAVNSLYEALQGFKTKEEIEKTLVVTQGNIGFAYDILFNAMSQESSQAKEQERPQEKMIGDYEVLNSISNLDVRAEVGQIIEMLPFHNPRDILKMYRHSNRDKEKTVARIFDGYVIPDAKSNTKVKVEDTGSGKGKIIKLEASSSTFSSSKPVNNNTFGNNSFSNIHPFSNHTFDSTLCRGTSSESEDHPRDTPGSSGSSQPEQGIPMRPAWSFDEMPGTSGSPQVQVPATRVNTDNDNDNDNDGYDLDNSEPDVEMALIKEDLEEEDIYGLSADDKVANLDSSSDDDDIDMSPPKEESSSSESDSDSDSDGQGASPFASDIDSSGNESNEQGDELTEEQKKQELLNLFPRAGINAIGIHLQLNKGNMEKAVADLEKEFGFRGNSPAERSLSPGIGPSCPRKSANLKRQAEASIEGRRQTKRSRWGEEDLDAEEDVNELDSAEKWVLNLLHSDTGIQIELDSGIHPCHLPENALRRVPGFRAWLAANPLRSGVERIMKVSEVSLEIFNLAMQWAVCSVGQLTRVQRKSKASEITAFIDLAIFASKVNIGLGKENGAFMTKLKAILIKYQGALQGSHVRKAFENLRTGHQIRKLFIQASLRPYVEFHNAGENLMETGESDSESIDEGRLNPAQRAAYRKDRFCYHSEFKQIEDYQNELLKEFHRVWWARNSQDQKYGKKHFCHITTLTDPLTGERFEV